MSLPPNNFSGPVSIGSGPIPQYGLSVQLAARWTTTPGGCAPGVTAFLDSPRGVYILPWTRVMSMAPAAASATNLGTSQTINAGASAVLTAGTGVTATTRGATTVYRLDTPRCVTITSAGNDSAITFTVSGFDEYGAPMTSAMTGGNTSGVTTPKAFLDITSVVASSTSAAGVSIGGSNIFGVPLYVSAPDQLLLHFDGTLQTTIGTFTAGDTTSPSTGATKDVRGTYSMTGTNGTKILSLGICNVNLSADTTPSGNLTTVISPLIVGVPQA